MELKDKIHKIKEHRLRPAEKFLYEILWSVKPYYSNKYLNSVFYKKDDEVLFEYDKKNRVFWYHNKKIWKVLYSKYELNGQEISDLINRVMWETLKLKDITPFSADGITAHRMWETLKLKDITPLKIIYK